MLPDTGNPRPALSDGCGGRRLRSARWAHLLDWQGHRGYRGGLRIRST